MKTNKHLYFNLKLRDQMHACAVCFVFNQNLHVQHINFGRQKIGKKWYNKCSPEKSHENKLSSLTLTINGLLYLLLGLEDF